MKVVLVLGFGDDFVGGEDFYVVVKIVKCILWCNKNLCIRVWE